MRQLRVRRNGLAAQSTRPLSLGAWLAGGGAGPPAKGVSEYARDFARLRPDDITPRTTRLRTRRTTATRPAQRNLKDQERVGRSLRRPKLQMLRTGLKAARSGTGRHMLSTATLPRLPQAPSSSFKMTSSQASLPLSAAPCLV